MGKVILLITLLFSSSLSAFKSPSQKIAFNFDQYEKDPKSLVSKDFVIPKELEPNVKFWFSIYTLYPSSSSVFHDKENLGLVYDIIDFSELAKSELNHFTRKSIQSRIVNEKIKKYKGAFKRLGENKGYHGPIEKKILRALKNVNFKIPHQKRKRRALFKNLSNNLRAQTGQKDFIAKGLKNIRPYRQTIEKYFETYELPHELLAIPFLESSFNLKAQSKVSAAGPWQFMPNMGNHFMRISKFQDHRFNPLIATNGALHLLAQNKQILKNWDLAVSAYNNGTGLLLKGIRKVRKKKKIKNPTLEDLIIHFKHDYFGFAARNFYSEFLALVYTLAYQEELFPKTKEAKKKDLMKIYIGKCKMAVKELKRLYKKSAIGFKELNNHLKGRRKSYPRSVYYTSDIELPSSRFYEVPLSKMRRNFPRNWFKQIKNQRCSTK